MLFNSFEFLVFFTLVCILFFALCKSKYQNPFLLIASYYFYMNWKPTYAVLILGSTIITYLCALFVERFNGNNVKQKTALVTSLILNFGILFVFKYFNFINESVFSVLSLCGLKWTVPNLDILLPVGISFYTFQAVGYSIDVYRGTIKAERNFFTYALFVSFFPQLVAGPIERAKNLLPQFHKEHPFEYVRAVEGCKQMIWGFFMKLCVGDVLGEYVNAVYNNVPNHNGTSFIIATIFFTFQIYCDFGGYSNIAIGAAKIMGFDLIENFKRPYFSLSMKEFWGRWHISLSSWFKDYVYIPLGGNRVSYPRNMFNIFATMIISGIWHGANWTFVIWGGIHGIFQIIENMFRKFIYTSKNENILSRVCSIILCFCLVAFAWIFFRANSVYYAFSIISSIFTNPGKPFIDVGTLSYGILALIILIFKDTKDEFGWKLNFMHSKYTFVRYASVVLLIAYILLFGNLGGGQFIYFQF